MNNLAEQVFEQVRSLGGSEMQEVLDFIGYLKSKYQPTVTDELDEAAD